MSTTQNDNQDDHWSIFSDEDSHSINISELELAAREMSWVQQLLYAELSLAIRRSHRGRRGY